MTIIVRLLIFGWGEQEHGKSNGTTQLMERPRNFTTPPPQSVEDAAVKLAIKINYAVNEKCTVNEENE